MRKVIILGFIFNVLVSISIYGQEEEWGIVSQEFYNRYYDRTVNLDFQISDPAMIAVGGAFISLANNPNAILMNPAGLTQLSRIQASFITQFNFDARQYSSPDQSGRKVTSSPDPHFAFPGAAVVLPLKLGSRQLTAGLAYHKIINPVSHYQETEFFYGGGRIDEIQDYTGGVHAIAGALGVEIIPQISVGVNYHYLFGTNRYHLKIQSPYADKRVYFKFEDEEEMSGGFLRVGLLLKPIKWILLGATVTPAWTYSSKELEERFQITDFILDTGWVTEYYETSEAFLSELKVEIPLVYHVGIAIHPFSTLTLAASYELNEWQKATLKLDGQTISNSLETVDAFHCGLEYRTGNERIQVPLRVGYYTNALPQRDQFFEGAYYGGQIERNFYTLGCGIYWGKYLVDFSYQQAQSEIGWWMRAADYYNQRMFQTSDTINQVLLSLSYRL